MEYESYSDFLFDELEKSKDKVQEQNLTIMELLTALILLTKKDTKNEIIH